MKQTRQLAIQGPIKTSVLAFSQEEFRPLPHSTSSVALSRRALNSEQGAHVENRLRFGILTMGNSFAHIRQNQEYVKLVSSLDTASFLNCLLYTSPSPRD